jgi:hypothetical protein
LSKDAILLAEQQLNSNGLSQHFMGLVGGC